MVLNYKHGHNNQQNVLSYIRTHPNCTRLNLQDELNLSRAAVANIVNRLLEAQFIFESPVNIPLRTRGKPFKTLHIKAEKGYFLGFSIHQWHISCCIIDFNLNVLWEKSLPIQEPFILSNAQSLYESLLTEVDQFLQEKELTNLAISIPAVIDQHGQIVDFALKEIELESLDLISPLKKILTIEQPNLVDHSTSISYFEAFKNRNTAQNIFILNLDYGLSGSTIINGSPYNGAQNHAGNIGAFFPYSGSRPSVIDLASHLNLPISALTIEAIDQRYKNKDPLLIQWIDKQAANLSMPLSVVTELIDPKRIILNGLFPASVLEALIQKIDLTVLEAPERVAKEKSQLFVSEAVGVMVSAYGAARYALHQFINR